MGTQDALHYRETVALLEKGYDIILEKPISTKMDELLDLRRRAAALEPVYFAVSGAAEIPPQGCGGEETLKNAGKSAA